MVNTFNLCVCTEINVHFHSLPCSFLVGLAADCTTERCKPLHYKLCTSMGPIIFKDNSVYLQNKTLHTLETMCMKYYTNVEYYFILLETHPSLLVEHLRMEAIMSSLSKNLGFSNTWSLKKIIRIYLRMLLLFRFWSILMEFCFFV